MEAKTGVLAASTAFGKTVVGAYLIAQRKVNTLVNVHRRQLLDRWVVALGQFLGLAPREIGQIGGGKHTPTGRRDVAMIQSLSQDGVVDDLGGNDGHVIVDECHHVSAVSFERVVSQRKARYVMGLSATGARKDGHQPIIFMQCGPIRHLVNDRRQANARPLDHKVVVRFTGRAKRGRLPPAPVHGRQRAQIRQDDIADAVRAQHGGRTKTCRVSALLRTLLQAGGNPTGLAFTDLRLATDQRQVEFVLTRHT